MKRSLIKLISLLVISTVFLTGCSSDVLVTIRPQSRSVPVSVSWWGNDPRHEYMIEGLRLFENNNPSIRIEYSYAVWNGYENRYQMLMRSRNNADVMQINYAWLSKYSDDGTGYYDLSLLSDVIDFDNFTDADIDTGMRNGVLNALPTAYNTSCFFYNGDIYSSYGLEAPSTWDDLFVAADRMREDGMYPLGMIYKHVFLVLNAWFEQNYEARLFDDDGNYIGNEDDVYNMLEFLGELVNNQVLMPPSEFEVSYFGAGLIAGVSCWASDSQRYCNELVENDIPVIVGDFLSSDNDNGSGWYIKPATMFAISSNCENPNEAGEVLNYLLNSPEFIMLQGTERGIPVSITALETLTNSGELTGVEYESGQIIRNNMDSMVLINPMLENSDVQDAFKTYADMYLYGEVPLEDAAAMLNEAFEAIG
ncbi:MAG: ABC transporter substrate-binding protein [Saccharofermentans sp.]|nr:ABC transporter substrate-binding protein [Saccharofermentans sp.]